jgi:glycosyltransferase involved in cell wall biosynthesis
MLLSNCFDPDPRVYAEAVTLAEHGHRVTVLGWDRDRKCQPKEVVDGIAVERIYVSSTHGRGSLQAVYLGLVWLAMIRRGLRHQFDVIHAHDFDTLPAGRWLASLRRKPLIYDSHEDYASMLHGRIRPAMQSLIRWWEGRLLRKVDCLITVGEKLRREFERRGARRTVVVANAKRIEEYRLDDSIRRQVREALDIPVEALTLAFIANLAAERFIPEMVGAVARRPKVHLIIGGRGPAATAVEQAAQRCRNIHYLGFVAPKDVPRYTCAADVLYYGFDPSNPNSRWSAPNKLYEAFAAGCALITGHFGEIGDVVAENDCGVVLDGFSEDEILDAIDRCSDPANLQLWKSRAAAAGKQQFNWSVSAHNLLQVYDEVLGR